MSILTPERIAEAKEYFNTMICNDHELTALAALNAIDWIRWIIEREREEYKDDMSDFHAGMRFAFNLVEINILKGEDGECPF